MQPPQARIAVLWCNWMHSAPMWPAHGQYECRICGRRHRVCWDDPLPAATRQTAAPYPALPASTSASTIASSIQCT
jgi:hypothetical protein